MSQTKDYRQDVRKTIVKTYILRECKFRTDLHTHMNANLDPDILIALGIITSATTTSSSYRVAGDHCKPEGHATRLPQRGSSQ